MRKNRNYRRRRREIHYHIGSIVGTNVTIGNTASEVTMTATNAGANTQLSEQEAELIRIFRLADERRKTEAMAYFFKLEESIWEATQNG